MASIYVSAGRVLKMYYRTRVEKSLNSSIMKDSQPFAVASVTHQGPETHLHNTYYDTSITSALKRAKRSDSSPGPDLGAFTLIGRIRPHILLISNLSGSSRHFICIVVHSTPYIPCLYRTGPHVCKSSTVHVQQNHPTLDFYKLLKSSNKKRWFWHTFSSYPEYAVQ